MIHQFHRLVGAVDAVFVAQIQLTGELFAEGEYLFGGIEFAGLGVSGTLAGEAEVIDQADSVVYPAGEPSAGGGGESGFIAVAAGMTGNATAADMTPSNIHTFEICAFYVPLILIVLSLLVFMFKVKIDEKMHAKIVKELEAKLASGEIVDDEAQTAETVEAIDEEAKTLTE